MNLFFKYHSGTEKTRDELRKQVYEAMAEKEKTEAVGAKLESVDGKGNTEVKQENGVVKSAGTHDVNGSQEPSSSPVNENEVQKAQVNGVEKSPGVPVNGAAESPTASPGKEPGMKREKDLKEQNGVKAKPEEGKDEESKMDDEEPEGSRSLDTEHCLCRRVED